MNVTRGLALIRLCTQVQRKSLLYHKLENNVFLQQKRSHGGRVYAYRKIPPDCPRDDRNAKLMSAFVWWWILWHCFTEYEELLGNSYPDPSKWTDEELGIPSS